MAIQTSTNSKNGTAEAETVRTTAMKIIEHKNRTERQNMLTITQALKHHKIRDLDNLTEILSLANTINNKAVIQWIPAHSNI